MSALVPLLIRNQLFKTVKVEKTPLAPLLRKAIDKKMISGELFEGVWHDVGTPKRLEAIQQTL